MKRFLEKVKYVLVSTILILGFMFCVGYLTYIVSDHIETKGLKNIVSDIWEGDNSN